MASALPKAFPSGGSSARKTVQWTVFSENGSADPSLRCPKGGEGVSRLAPWTGIARTVPVSGDSSSKREIQYEYGAKERFCLHKGRVIGYNGFTAKPGK